MFVPFPDIVPQRCDIRPIHNTLAAPPSVATGLQQVQSRNGSVWGARLEWTDLNDDKRHRLRQFLSAMRGGESFTHFHDFAHSRNGALIGSDDNANIAPWPTNTCSVEPSSGYAADFVQVVARDDGGIQATRSKTDATRVRLLNVDLGTVSGSTVYTIDFDVGLNGATDVIWRVADGTGPAIAGFYEIPDEGANLSVAFTTFAGTSSVRLEFELQTGGSGTMLVNNIKLTPHRALQGATLTQRSALAGPFTASTNGMMKAGDMVKISGQMLRLTADVNSDTGGNALMTWEPALRRTGVSNAIVQTHKPGALFRVVDAEVSEPARPGIFSSFVIDFVEVIRDPVGAGTFVGAV